MGTTAVFEFHVSRPARDRYSFDQALFAFNGNVVFANPAAARQFAFRINEVRGTTRDPERAAKPAELFAMGLIDEVLHAIVTIYRRRQGAAIMSGLVNWCEERFGVDALNATLLKFVTEFPPVAVYQRKQTPEQWLAGSTEGLSHRMVAVEELMMLWLSNANQAYRPYVELFEDKPLTGTSYRELIQGLREYFAAGPTIGPNQQTLFDALLAPALASPDSLAGQLAYLRDTWGDELGEILVALLTGLDVLKEEELATWMMFHPIGHQRQHGGGWLQGESGAAAILQFGPHEYERFSPDVDWMPGTVLLAKTVYVWLDQLSKKYGRRIQRLNEIPDEELAIMSRRGFNSLWLIGVWERSTASRRIKQLMGNTDAAASAYSLYDYQIAADLGGESAYRNLRDRAFARGIRLASDMVPNHMGIDSRWMIEHPDWFVSLPYPPYPAYSFNGPDLSTDGRVEIKIEDHYYDKTDAAVVFMRRDRFTGDTRFIYHGNDGTTFPWNDTAQLNYLDPRVREGVIQTIIHVARMFPIIRFDAAMTLAKQHYQRLWFPQPGTGGAIPSRAEHGLTKQQFDEAMPQEFWREVVDRIAREVPGTLLLAEAFWLLEGYFVRTLGMHRVYNSAFMNMLRDEENANYRKVLKNTLEFDPDVLKRYVNFMNNPDERTAVDQFGKGDKYFGVCTLLATFPGLPMFGHGQIEGFTERYGMEFRRPMFDEQPDQWLASRHEREISPLLHLRPLFAESENFLLYDFYTEQGHVNEDVFAYSNRRGDQRALIVYNNRYADTRGWVRLSAAYAEKQPDGSKQLRQRTLGDSFGFSNHASHFVSWRDALSGMEFLRRSHEVVEQGLFFQLGAYQRAVLLDFQDLREDADHPWSQLCDWLNGRGVSSLTDALITLQLQPLHDALKHALAPEVIAEFAGRPAPITEPPAPTAPKKRAAKAAKQTKAQAEAKHEVAPEVAPKMKPKTAPVRGGEQTPSNNVPRELLTRARRFADELTRFTERQAHEPGAGTPIHPIPAAAMAKFETLLRQRLEFARRMPELAAAFSKSAPATASEVLPFSPDAATHTWAAVVAWCVLDAIANAASPAQPDRYAVLLFDAARLRQPIADALGALGLEGESMWRAVARLRFAFAHAASRTVPTTAREQQPTPTARLAKASAQLSWAQDPETAWLIGTHEYQGERYFNKEEFERLVWWMALPTLMEIASEPTLNVDRLRELEREIDGRCRIAETGGYRIEALLDLSTLM